MPPRTLDDLFYNRASESVIGPPGNPTPPRQSRLELRLEEMRKELAEMLTTSLALPPHVFNMDGSSGGSSAIVAAMQQRIQETELYIRQREAQERLAPLRVLHVSSEITPERREILRREIDRWRSNAYATPIFSEVSDRTIFVRGQELPPAEQRWARQEILGTLPTEQPGDNMPVRQDGEATWRRTNPNVDTVNTAGADREWERESPENGHVAIPYEINEDELRNIYTEISSTSLAELERRAAEIPQISTPRPPQPAEPIERFKPGRVIDFED